MSTRTLGLDEALRAYIHDIAVDESELLRQLREETAQLDMAVMQISPEQGQFMSLLVQLCGAKRALEIGTFTGYSAICIATAMQQGGRLTCCDVSAEWTAMAQKYWTRAGLDACIELKLQPAEQSLRQLLDQGEAGCFDFVFIDADKGNYIRYYELSLQLLRPGGLIAIDNTLWSGSVVDADNQESDTVAIRRFNEHLKNDSRVSRALVTIGDGLSLAIKNAA